MNIKDLTNEELIQLFKDNSLSMQAIEHKYNLGKNSVGRLFTKRGINFREIKEQETKRIREEYETNPKCCKNCGKPISFEERIDPFQADRLFQKLRFGFALRLTSPVEL